ncbi:chitosanase [Microbacterium sp. ZW T6_19]|uniref:chitosanase n=1 Tax=Microbacterium sp. ZW T6_19 TaxID=3378082 RepID=UPI003853A590
MRQRRPLLALLAAAALIPLAGLVATSAQAASPVTLRDPIKREIAQEIITSAENSSLNWYDQYSYIEPYPDGRGLTGGIVGFTSGTHDMLVLVQNYTKKHPANRLAKWIDELEQVDGTDETAPLGEAYMADWRAEGAVPAFQQAQRDEVTVQYFDPAVDLAIADGLGALGQFAYYDAAVVHGFSGLQDVRSEAKKSATTPASGGSQTTYLNAFLDARVIEMQKEEAHEDVSRIENAQRVWLDAGNLDLDTPLNWSVYGDPYSIPTAPTPHWPVSGTTPTPTPTTTPGTATLISKNKPVTASTVEGTGFEAAKAVDGNATTRWASVEGVDPQWVRIDLGTGSTVNKVVLKWEAAYASKYRIETSNDGTTWTTLATEAAGNGGTDEFTNLTGTGRYLRIYGTARGTAYGYSLYEAEVYTVTGGGTTPTSTPTPTPTPTPTAPTGPTWPGSSQITVADGADTFGTDLSGLSFSADGSALWAVNNGSGTLHRLVRSGSNWAEASGWSGGRTLRYTNGSGAPDAEGVVAVGSDLFVASERNGSSKSTSRPSILQYRPGASSGSLTALKEWNLTSDLPSVGANDGLESIAWIPDADLVASGFVDQHTGSAYSPASYANHGDGLFFVGLEADGKVYAYALNLSGGFTRVASFASGFDTVMELEYQPSTRTLWSVCDDSCDGAVNALKVTSGAFAVAAEYDRPAAMPNINNEGFALAPACVGGARYAIWADDSDTSDHALRAGSMSCS